ncbi:hypothetical protein HOLleu_36241 [Holothuria leucospilota]|uniref:Uncharacterized protein n=1 Tax=Holothuria leucospilota TaxID=206669 RepID=A0A9Q0YJP9_HOLLE|nr:hypothetical protein HOLleu_36241 [Holothuria leucospilota]
MRLVVCLISGNPYDARAFVKKQQKSFHHHGKAAPRSNINVSIRNGLSTVVRGRLVYFDRL